MPSHSMMSLAPKAVSEYEHLNNASSWKDHFSDYEEEEDYIPLKPVRSSQTLVSKLVPISSTNTNNSNFQRSDLFSLQTNDDEHFQPANAIPVPMGWSPIKTNPSLWLTPDKEVKKITSKQSSVPENVLEPQDINTVPVPLEWSPGMMVRPDPSLFITPEKVAPAKAAAVIRDNSVKQCSSDTKENFATSGLFQSTGGKEKHTVRFDLPSASSAEETFEGDDTSFSEVGSPITLRGSAENPADTSSPQWKVFSPPKAYNPNVYSDESSLDDSHAVLVVQPDTNTETLLCKSQPAVSKFTSASSKKSDIIKTAVQQQKRSKTPPQKTDSGTDQIPKGGPQYIRSPYSQYESKQPAHSVIREAKNKFVSTDYSFPFEAGAVGGDAECEHVFARPEYNSTLKVRAELDTLCQQEVDVDRALHETLAKSEQTRTDISEKASLYTNRNSDQFSNLVNLDPSVGGLCDRIVRMRMSQAPKKRRSAKKSSQANQAPDLQEFFSPDLQHDSPDLSLPGFAPDTPRLISAPDDIAFDLYRHNRVWNGINDL